MILILGAQGVGKTTVGKKVAERLKYKYVNFGDVVQSMIKENRDEFRRKSKLESFKRIQKKAVDKILKMRRRVILTSHALLLRKDGFFPGFPLNLIKKLKPKYIIFLYSNPEDIKKRRERDKRKGRDVSTIGEINFEQKLSEHAAMIYSIIVGSPVAFVENREGEVENTVKKIIEMLK